MRITFIVSFFIMNSVCWGNLFEGPLKFKISPWKTQCDSMSCGIPEPFVPSQVVIMTPVEVTQPGQAARTYQSFDFSGELRGRIELYSIYPRENLHLPPYLQVQMFITSPVDFFCMESVRWREPFEMPPLICGTMDSNLLRWGVTLELVP